jgi:hypothetical protein
LLAGGSSAAVVHELEDITANTPLRLDRFQRFEDQVGSWRRWQLLNVRYVLDSRDLDGPGLERVYEEDGVKVYRLGDPLPRAWVVHGGVVLDDSAALESLNLEDFDPRRTAILGPESEALVPYEVGKPGAVAKVVEALPGRLVLDVAPEETGLLVVSQPFYPGWQARVDGEEVPLERVDYLLQGVPVESGLQRVELTFRASTLPAVVSLAVLVLCAAGLVLFWRRRDPGS